MGLLSGLGGMGLGKLEGMSLFDEPEKEAVKKQEQPIEKKPVEIKEEDFLFEKSYRCPVCDKEFKAISVRAGKAKLSSIEFDLRPKYDNVEPLKYDVVMCTNCGCAAITRYWGNVTDSQRKNIKDNISRAFRGKKYDELKYSYEDAFDRYQVALANAMVKQAKNSEKAYICLKTGWMLKAEIDSLDKTSDDYEKKLAELTDQKDEFLKNALQGMIVARSKETFPICGMDESTLDYLIAALSVQYKEYEQAKKLIGNLLASKTASSRIKEKARDLKEMLPA